MFFRHALTKARMSKLLLGIVVIIFLVMPFSTPITVFIGTKLDHFSLFKIWKELAMVLALIPVMLSGIYHHFGNIRQHLFKILAWLIVGYSLWAIALGILNLTVFHQINWEAFIYALIVDLRFLFFFLLCWLVAQDSAYLKTHWRKLLLIPASIVVTFGVLQYFVLPANVLSHIGYGPKTITPYQLVDQKPDYVRIESTLRGPNPLGVYLILVITAALVGFGKKRLQQAFLLIASFITLFASYSRSAWIGVMLSLGSFSFVSIPSSRLRKIIVVSGLAGVLLVTGGVYLARNNHFVQNTVFHTDSTSKSPESSNAGRSHALKWGTEDVLTEPFGRGPGSAGPASLRNNHPERIAENYYLQIGQEYGWIGLGVFIAINVIVVMLLWKQKNEPLAKVLLASFVGITFANLVSHAWTDDTLALIWWGLAGIALAPAVLKNKKSQTSSNIDNKPA